MLEFCGNINFYFYEFRPQNYKKIFNYNSINLQNYEKIFLSALLVLTALTGAMAAWPSKVVKLIKHSNSVIITRPDLPPGADPLSVTEDDNFLSPEAALDDESISLTATAAVFAQVTIEDESGAIVYDQLELLGNEPTAISTEGWASGAYVIYIEIGDDLYEGAFEL